MINIRQEESEDVPAVRAVNEQAFGQSEEADIIDVLRTDCANLLSLVALYWDKIVGHILFSPAVIESEHGRIEGMGLAPVAVLPEYQNQGIGSILVQTGLDILRERRCPFVIVLGHPQYYPRFGFDQASDYGLKSQWDGVPDNAFMVLFIDESLKNNVSGLAKYRDEFDIAM